MTFKLTIRKIAFIAVLVICFGFLIYNYLPRGEMPKAERLIAAGEYTEALPILRRVVKVEPENCKARWMLAEAYFFTGDPEESERLMIGYAQEVEADPRYASLFAALARHWQDEDDWVRAMDNWHRAIDMGFNITVREYNESVALYYLHGNRGNFEYMEIERDEDISPLTDLVEIINVSRTLWPGPNDNPNYQEAVWHYKLELYPLLSYLKDPATWEDYDEDVVGIARRTTDKLEALRLLLTLREEAAAFDAQASQADSWVIQQLLESMQDYESPELTRELLIRLKTFHPDLEIIERLLQLLES